MFKERLGKTGCSSGIDRHCSILCVCVVCVCVCERERERERGARTFHGWTVLGERARETDRQTDRQTDGQTDRSHHMLEIATPGRGCISGSGPCYTIDKCSKTHDI